MPNGKAKPIKNETRKKNFILGLGIFDELIPEACKLAQNRRLFGKKKMKLTPFQKRLCKLRLAGASEKEIAQGLRRSAGTVRNDFVAIRKILQIQTLEEAFADYLKKEADPVNDMSRNANAVQLPPNQQLPS